MRLRQTDYINETKTIYKKLDSETGSNLIPIHILLCVYTHYHTYLPIHLYISLRMHIHLNLMFLFDTFPRKG